MGAVLKNVGQELPIVGIESRGHGYFARRAEDIVRIAIDGPWDTPAGAIQPVPPDLCVANSILISWIAFPQLSRSSDRAKHAKALYADAAHRACRGGLCKKSDIPSRASAKAIPKAKRDRLVQTTEQLAEKRIEDAFAMLFPLEMRDLPIENIRWKGAKSLNEVIERIDPENGWNRRWRPIVPIVHLAYAIGQLGIPDTVEKLSALLKHAECGRTTAALVKKPKIELTATVQFRPI